MRLPAAKYKSISRGFTPCPTSFLRRKEAKDFIARNGIIIVFLGDGIPKGLTTL